MKVYSLLILLCLETLICDIERLNATLFHETFNSSIQYLRAFHPKPFYVLLKPPLNKWTNIVLNYAYLNGKNVEFKFDEFGMLHVKYINLKLNLNGKFASNDRRNYRYYTSFTAELINSSVEQIYSVKSQKLENGKNGIKYRHLNDSEVSFKAIKIYKNSSGSKMQNSIKTLIKNINFSPLKSELKKVTNVVLDKLSSNLK